jgi:hypothetical protein
LGLGIWYLELGTWNLELGIWNLEFEPWFTADQTYILRL